MIWLNSPCIERHWFDPFSEWFGARLATILGSSSNFLYFGRICRSLVGRRRLRGSGSIFSLLEVISLELLLRYHLGSFASSIVVCCFFSGQVIFVSGRFSYLLKPPCYSLESVVSMTSKRCVGWSRNSASPGSRGAGFWYSWFYHFRPGMPLALSFDSIPLVIYTQNRCWTASLYLVCSRATSDCSSYFDSFATAPWASYVSSISQFSIWSLIEFSDCSEKTGIYPDSPIRSFSSVQIFSDCVTNCNSHFSPSSSAMKSP